MTFRFQNVTAHGRTWTRLELTCDRALPTCENEHIDASGDTPLDKQALFTKARMRGWYAAPSLDGSDHALCPRCNGRKAT